MAAPVMTLAADVLRAVGAPRRASAMDRRTHLLHPDWADGLLRHARRALRIGGPLTALRELSRNFEREGFRAPPEVRAALLALGTDCLSLCGEDALAEETLARAEAARPGHDEVAVARARLRARQGRAEEALDLCRAALAHTPLLPGAVLLGASLLEKSDRADEAADWLIDAAEQTEVADFTLALARLFTRQGRYQAVAGCLSHYESLLPLLEKAGREQLDAWYGASAVPPEPAEPRAVDLDLPALAAALWQRPDAEAAFVVHVAAGSLKPGLLADRLVTLSDSTLRTRGLAAVEQGLHRVPHSAALLDLCAALLHAEGRTEEALRLCECDDWQRVPPVLRLRAAGIFAATDRVSDAIALCDSVLTDPAAAPAAALRLWHLHTAAGRHANALEYARRLRMACPEDETGWRLSAESHLALGEAQAAARNALNALQRSPAANVPAAGITAGLIKEGDHRAAGGFLSTLRECQPDAPTGLADLVMECYHGTPTEARRALDTILRSDGPGAEQCLKAAVVEFNRRGETRAWPKLVKAACVSGEAQNPAAPRAWARLQPPEKLTTSITAALKLPLSAEHQHSAIITLLRCTTAAKDDSALEKGIKRHRDLLGSVPRLRAAALECLTERRLPPPADWKAPD